LLRHLLCSIDLLPLIRVLQCDANHLVCSYCRGAHGEACGRPVAHSTLADDFTGAVFVPCDYEKYGCTVGDVVYHEAADHRRACQHAPCGCPELCGFSGSLQKLLKHIAEHSRPILHVRYGQPGALSLPLAGRWQVLVGEDDTADRRRNVFLVSAVERGADKVELSLLCIRADGSVPPQFSCKIAVEHPDNGTRQTLESPVMKSSSLCSGAPAPGEVKCLTVKKDYLSGSGDSVPITIQIDRLAHPPPFSSNGHGGRRAPELDPAKPRLTSVEGDKEFAPPPTSEGRTSQVLKFFYVSRRNREAADQ
jgi:hypothetical protein